MEHIVDCKITKVYEGPNGEGEWGKWQVYNLYLDKGPKEKFGWMQSGKKLIPKEGMQLKHVGYEIEEDGQYTNYKIKEMELTEGKSTPKAIPNTKEDMGAIPNIKNDREVSFYVAYAKDIAIAMLTNGGDLINLEAVCSQVAKAGVKLMNESLNNDQISSQVNKTVAPVEDNGKGKPDPAQEEEARKLRATLKKYAKANSELYFKTLGMHGASKAEEAVGFEKEAQESLLKDLEKAFDDIPF